MTDSLAGLPIGVDSATMQFAQHMLGMDWRRAIDVRARELAKRADHRVGRAANLVAGAEATEYLTSLIEAVTADLVELHAAYGRVRWLWYLRRAPDELFAGAYRSTLGYDRALAEALSWSFDFNDVSTNDKMVAFRADGSAFRSICNYVAGVKLLSHLHAIYRRVGKGATLDTTDAVPFADHEESVEKAIAIYDTRHDQVNEVTRVGLGLAPEVADASAFDVNAAASRLILFLHCQPLPVPVVGPDGHGKFIRQQVTGRYALQSAKADSMLQPFLPARIEAPYLQGIEPFLLLLMMYPVLAARIPWVLSSTVQFGYFFAPIKHLAPIFDSWLPALGEHMKSIAPGMDCSPNYAEWRRRILAVAPALWPLRSGGVVRDYREGSMIDIGTASSAVLQHLEIDRTLADLANQRAHAFELQIQSVIDASPWRPSARLGKLRGVTLLRDGNAITDIDAIGMKGGELLVVSCKSVIYDRAYDQGDFRVVRNVESTISDGVATWRDVTDRLGRERVGDNFDFGEFERIVGVVCTPFVVYSANPSTLGEIAQGLRACVSAIELRDWLSI